MSAADWVERQKKKKVIIEEMMEIKTALQFRDNSNDIDDEVWRSWKRRHHFSSFTWDLLLSHPRQKYFTVWLTNDARLKRKKDIVEKFADEVTFLQRFMKLKYSIPLLSRGASFRGLDTKLLVVTSKKSFNFGSRTFLLAILDVRKIKRPEVPNHISSLQPFLDFVANKLNPDATDISVWLWILGGAEDFRAAAKYAAAELPEYECVQSLYLPSRAQRLDNVSARLKVAPNVRLLFLF